MISTSTPPLVLSGSDLNSNPDVRKILAAAAYGQISLQQRADKPTMGHLSRSVPTSTSAWTLSYGDKVQMSKVDSALRFLGQLASPVAASLMGSGPVEQAQTDAWLSFFWSTIDLPLQAMMIQANGSSDAAMAKEFQEALERISHHLLRRTFLVGEQITTADIALSISLDTAIQAKLWTTEGSSLTPLLRHFDTLKNQPWFNGKAATGGQGVVGPAIAGDGVMLNGPSPNVVHKMYRRNRIRIKELLLDNGSSYIDQIVTVAGWARTVRKASSKLLFIEINDGSANGSLQCVLDKAECEGFDGCKTSGGTGASFSFTGKLIASQGTGQAVELHVKEAKLLGAVWAGDATGTTIGGGLYPVSKKEHTLEHLRDVAHLRARTAVHAAAMRIRHCMAYATHNFFHNHGFLYIHTPIITGADCEGAGEQFAVTSLLGSDHLKVGVELPVHPPAETKELSKSEMKRQAKKKEKGGDDKISKDQEPVVGAVDYTKDFFGQRVNLTVSGQLNVETHACALSDVYTFGPTFRAEYSFTSRHLSEFWMIEPEIAFADLTDDINLAEDYLKYCVQYALENCSEDLEFFENNPVGEKGLRERLKNVLDNPFKRLTYTEAIELLQKAVREDGVKFEEEPVWGIDLPSEHERYICEKVYKQPVVLTDYPKEIKAFYMKLNDDGKTVAAADVLVPKIGEIIGGSQREHRMDVLKQRCLESNLDPSAVWWYLDLRRYGTVPHAGFGLGFERLVLFVTGLSNIRDVIPFPRWAGNSKF